MDLKATLELYTQLNLEFGLKRIGRGRGIGARRGIGPGRELGRPRMAKTSTSCGDLLEGSACSPSEVRINCFKNLNEVNIFRKNVHYLPDEPSEPNKIGYQAKRHIILNNFTMTCVELPQ